MRTYVLVVSGYAFDVLCDPRYINDYLLDGIDIEELVFSVPEWYVDLKLPIRLWWWLQKLHLVWK